MDWWREWQARRPLRRQIRKCFHSLPPQAQQEPKVALRELGRHGWLGAEWSAPSGAADASPWVGAAVGAEYGYSWLATLPAYLGNDIAGGTLARVGTTVQKEKFLPGIASGSTLMSLGYTEPDSGSDLASLRTESRREGDHYLVNGTKIFISFAKDADYLLLATRAGQRADDRRGHTVLLVDTSQPGVEITCMPTIAGEPVTVVSLTDVVVPADMLVAEEGEGWAVLRLALDIERSGFQFLGMTERVLEETMTSLKESGAVSKTTRQLLADIKVSIAVVDLLCARVIWLQEQDRPCRSEASSAKATSTELLQRACHAALRALGIRAASNAFFANALLYSTVTTVFGGTSEIQRNIISQTLGLRGK
jgi:alkylation response protein AidB-like acyl-CoA dehydrogenase